MYFLELATVSILMCVLCQLKRSCSIPSVALILCVLQQCVHYSVLTVQNLIQNHHLKKPFITEVTSSDYSLYYVNGV